MPSKSKGWISVRHVGGGKRKGEEDFAHHRGGKKKKKKRREIDSSTQPPAIRPPSRKKGGRGKRRCTRAAEKGKGKETRLSMRGQKKPRPPTPSLHLSTKGRREDELAFGGKGKEEVAERTWPLGYAFAGKGGKKNGGPSTFCRVGEGKKGPSVSAKSISSRRMGGGEGEKLTLIMAEGEKKKKKKTTSATRTNYYSHEIFPEKVHGEKGESPSVTQNSWLSPT